MKIMMWLYGSKVRALVYDGEAVIDMCNDWNNRASAEAWGYGTYPTAKQFWITKGDEIESLNAEWLTCKEGE